MPVMMKCGHAANATDPEGKPGCSICIGLGRGADEIDDAPPNLEGRMAQCSCGRIAPSDPKALAFFEYCGPESQDATNICACGYAHVAHTPDVMARNAALKCTAFTPRGPRELDRYYCGCRGWD